MVKNSSALNDSTLAELIRVKNFKQALKNVDKKLKKQPKDVELLILKADFLLQTGDYESCRKLIQDLTSRTPAISEPDLVSRVYQTSHTLSVHGSALPIAQLDALWQNAIKAETNQAKKLELAEQWASDAVAAAQWAQVVKAAGTLSRLKSDDPYDVQKYYFWQILGQWLTKPSPEVTDERLRGLSKQMAVRMLEKTVEQTSPELTPKSGAGIVQHSQFDLLRYIYFESNKDTQLLQAIREKYIGSHSSKAVDEWGTFNTELQFYDRQKNLEYLWKLALDTIKDARSRGVKWRSDDWKCYEILLKSSGKKRLQSTKDLLADIVSEDIKARSPNFAQLHLLYDNSKHRTADGGSGDKDKVQSELLEKAQNVFDLFGDQAGCPEDVQEAITELNPQSQENLRKYIHAQNETTAKSMLSLEKGQLTWITREVNVLAIDFKIISNQFSAVETDERTRQQAYLVNFICQCLKLYKISLQHTSELAPTDTGPGDSACILATRALMELQKSNSNDVHVVQAACLLTSMLHSSKHNFSARLMLINLLCHLGLPTLALQHYYELGVKEILVEPCCPMMFSRISTLLPFPLNGFDPEDSMKKSLSFYANALQQIPRHQVTSLENENYVPCIELDSFLSDIQNSDTRRMLVYERRRIARLRGIACSEEGLGLEEHPMNKSDLDSAALGPSWMKTMQDKILTDHPPPMSAAYIDILGMILDATDFSSTQLPSSISPKRLDHWKISNRSQVTFMESFALEWIAIIISIRAMVSTSAKPQANLLQEQLDGLQSLLSLMPPSGTPKHPDVYVSHWKNLHYHVFGYEILHGTHQLISKLRPQVKSLQKPEIDQQLNSIMVSTRDKYKLRKQGAQGMLGYLQEMTRDDKLFKTTFTVGPDTPSITEEERQQIREAILDVVGEAEAKTIIGAFAKGGVDALNSVIQNLKDF